MNEQIYNFVSIYRSPNGNGEIFIEILGNILQKIFNNDMRANLENANESYTRVTST